jgi:hypothetical protein
VKVRSGHDVPFTVVKRHVELGGGHFDVSTIDVAGVAQSVVKMSDGQLKTEAV